jgi:hypothetical protein
VFGQCESIFLLLGFFPLEISPRYRTISGGFTPKTGRVFLCLGGGGYESEAPALQSDALPLNQSRSRLIIMFINNIFLFLQMLRQRSGKLLSFYCSFVESTCIMYYQNIPILYNLYAVALCYLLYKVLFCP